VTLAAVTFDLWHTLIKLPPAVEDRYIESQEETLSVILEAAPSVGRSKRGPFVRPKEAAHLAFASAVGRNGQGSPVSALALYAADLAGRKANSELWVRSIEALVQEQPFEEVPGARSQLKRLKAEGYRTAVISNIVGETGKSVRKVMERLDMARFIDSWALSEELPWAKPSPEIFWKALEPLDTPPSDAVHIGDLGSDIYGARAAGFRSPVQFLGAREYGPLYATLCRTSDAIDPPPEHVITSWDELPPLLESLFSDRKSLSGQAPNRRKPRRN
jgi:HAD superfamily hydrolase (TIGR01549 family)